MNHLDENLFSSLNQKNLKNMVSQGNYFFKFNNVKRLAERI
jgi:hypothetical protein